MKVNQIKSEGKWLDVCALSRALANSLDGRSAMEDLAYIATDSLGGRKWKVKAGSIPVTTLPSHNGLYLGFAECQLDEVQFTSGSSGAQIRAQKRRNGRWVFRFRGTPELEDRGFESNYAATFEDLGLRKLSSAFIDEQKWRQAAFREWPQGVRKY